MNALNDLSNTSPIELMAQLDRRDTLLFDSSGNFPQSYASPVSILATNPSEVLQGNIRDLTRLRAVMSQYGAGSEGQEARKGGLAGWIDYNGDYTFGVYPQFMSYDHQAAQWVADEVPALSFKDTNAAAFDLGEWSSSMTPAQFQSAVRAAKEYIAAGDIYQVNLSQRFSASLSTDADLFSLYQRLRQESPAPMACYGQLAGRELLCSSPETFFKIKGRQIETRPIKGTSQRYPELDRDRLSAQELMTSPKEKAELIMITDLLRNDLGQVCEYGSVRVDELLALEQLQHVYHLVSTVSGQLRPEVDHLQALQSCLPGGSITGAPKLRAMDVIKELEMVERGLYTGVVGYIGFNGESQFNIVIRSLIREANELSYHVGAGIVADSDPEREFHETLVKAEGIRRALA